MPNDARSVLKVLRLSASAFGLDSAFGSMVVILSFSLTRAWLKFGGSCLEDFWKRPESREIENEIIDGKIGDDDRD